jgi:iron(III) transport system permease protein
MAILVVNTIVHSDTVAQLTALTALEQMDPEFEAVSASLEQPFYKRFWRVTRAGLWAPGTELASVSVIDMDDSGQTVAAAAMAMMIFYTNVAARTVHAGLGGWRDRRPQAWRCG